jgi:hypothetical protein
MMHCSSCQHYAVVTFALKWLQVLEDAQIQHDVTPENLQLACELQEVVGP